MKRLILCLLFFSALVQVGYAQDNVNVLWSEIMHVKKDKAAEFEKRLPVFLKTHFPTLSFRVYEVLTGANTGAFVLASGPYAYKEFDQPMVSPKGEAAQKADGQALDALTESIEVRHMRRVTAISMARPERKIKFVMATTRNIKLGSWGDINEILVKLKAARVAGSSKMDVDFLRPVGSGSPNLYVAIRFFDKWEDLDYEENLSEMYDKTNGNGSWARDVARLNELTVDATSEMRVLRPDLSTMK